MRAGHLVGDGVGGCSQASCEKTLYYKVRSFLECRKHTLFEYPLGKPSEVIKSFYFEVIKESLLQ